MEDRVINLSYYSTYPPTPLSLIHPLYIISFTCYLSPASSRSVSHENNNNFPNNFLHSAQIKKLPTHLAFFFKDSYFLWNMFNICFTGTNKQYLALPLFTSILPLFYLYFTTILPLLPLFYLFYLYFTSILPLFYLYFTFFNVTSILTFSNSSQTFSKIALVKVNTFVLYIHVLFFHLLF